MPKLEWVQWGNSMWTALLGSRDDGVSFLLSYQPTCYRRGRWRLLVTVLSIPEAWGCFDCHDAPLRFYHHETCARGEAQAIADVLWQDRYGREEGPIHHETPCGGKG